MGRGKKWTPAEDSVVVDCIESNPGNIEEAQKTASLMLKDRSFAAVRKRYYGLGVKNHLENTRIGIIRYQNHIVFLETSKVKIANTKNVQTPDRALTHQIFDI